MANWVKYGGIALIGGMLSPGVRGADSTFTPYWAVRCDLMPLVFHTLAVGVEYHPKPHWSWVGGVILTHRWFDRFARAGLNDPPHWPDEEHLPGTLSGVGGWMEGRLFLSNGRSPGGLFLFSEGMYRRITVSGRKYAFPPDGPPRLVDIPYRYVLHAHRITSGMGISSSYGAVTWEIAAGVALRAIYYSQPVRTRLAFYIPQNIFRAVFGSGLVDYYGVYPTIAIAFGFVNNTKSAKR